MVELYFASPYTDYDKQYGVEKAAKDLCAFAKTDLLEPGQSQTLTLTLNADDLASYDSKGHGCYLAEAGTYYLYVSTDAHNVKEGCEPIEYVIASDRVYNDDGVGKRDSDLVVAENQFDIAYTDGNIGTEEKPYLSRQDFEGTNPNNFLEGYLRKILINMGPEMVSYMQTSLGGSDVDLLAGDEYKDPDFVFVSDEDKGLMIEDMVGVPYDDEKWTDFVGQLSLDEMIGTLKEGFTGTLAIEKVGVKATANTEGPSGVSSLNSNKAGNQYAAEPVTAATWNVELAAKVGSAIGRECVVGGFASINGPAMNTHRTPYGGRNGEYYSEDGFLAGTIGAAQVKAQQAEGVYCLIKHFALNETDQGRGGMYTWTTEQAAREIYLVPFELSIKDGGASGVMSSYNRIGPMETCTSRGLNYHILRQEWGFIGTVATDGYSKDMTGDYMIIDNQLFAGAGTLLYIGEWSVENTGLSTNVTESDYGKQVIFENAKNFLYRYANAGTGNITLDLTPYWLSLVVALELLLLGVILLVTFRVTVPAATGKEKGSRKKLWIAIIIGIVVIAVISGAIAANLAAKGKALREGTDTAAEEVNLDGPVVTDLSFDFATGEYSFSGVEGAAEYRIRIYLNTDGVDSELPSNESQSIRGGEASYTGTMPVWSLKAGQKYNAYVLTTYEDGSSAMGTAVEGVCIGEFTAITSGVTATITDNIISVTFASSALSNSYSSGADYEIVLLQDGVEIDRMTLANADASGEMSGASGEASGEAADASADESAEAPVQFEVSDPAGNYSVTVQALAPSEYFVDSPVSEPFAVVEPSEVVAEETSGEASGEVADASGEVSETTEVTADASGEAAEGTEVAADASGEAA